MPWHRWYCHTTQLSCHCCVGTNGYKLWKQWSPTWIKGTAWRIELTLMIFPSLYLLSYYSGKITPTGEIIYFFNNKVTERTYPPQRWFLGLEWTTNSSWARRIGPRGQVISKSGTAPTAKHGRRLLTLLRTYFIQDLIHVSRYYNITFNMKRSLIPPLTW